MKTKISQKSEQFNWKAGQFIYLVTVISADPVMSVNWAEWNTPTILCLPVYFGVNVILTAIVSPGAKSLQPVQMISIHFIPSNSDEFNNLLAVFMIRSTQSRSFKVQFTICQLKLKWIIESKFNLERYSNRDSFRYLTTIERKVLN